MGFDKCMSLCNSNPFQATPRPGKLPQGPAGPLRGQRLGCLRSWTGLTCSPVAWSRVVCGLAPGLCCPRSLWSRVSAGHSFLRATSPRV